MASNFLSDFLPQKILKRYFPSHFVTKSSRSAQFNIRNIYIVPTLVGLALLGVVLLILIAAINFQNSMMYMVCFWLSSLLIINILYTFKNLSGLQLTLIGAEPCFAGQNCLIQLSASSTCGKSSLFVGWKQHDICLLDFNDSETCHLTISYPSTQRGYLMPPRMDVFTHYPTGLVVAWAYARLNIKAIVYPKPVLMDITQYADTGQQDASDGQEIANGVNDFSGMKSYEAGDRIQRIHWAKFAQTQQLYTKQFVDHANHDLWLDWASLSSGTVEQRLSHLSARVLALHAKQQAYGLRLPSKVIEPGSSETHQNNCLTALALYN